MYQPAAQEAVTGRDAYFFPGLLLRRFSLLVAVLALSPLASFAQVATGSLNGTVLDPSGAAVPDAQVVMKNQATGVTRQTVSNNSGFFNITAVQPGTYTVTISAQGFNSWQQNQVVFNQGDNRSLPNISLTIAGATQQVQVVEANSEVAPADTGENSQTLNTRMVTELSIQGRNAAELIRVMPGVGLNTGLGQGAWTSLTTGTNSGPVGQYSVNGTQPNGGLSMTSDGANVVDPGNQGAQILNLNQDQIQEVKILTSAFGAEYAKGPTTFQAISKSGSATFHGGGYLYARHGILNATDSYFKNQGIAKPEDHQYYPGGTLGGPVLIPGTRFNRNRDKLFFFTGYEYMNQQPAGTLHSYFVPTQQMLQGNFSPSYLQSLGPAFTSTYGNSATVPCQSNGAGGFSTGNATACAALGNSIVNGVISPSAFDPNSLALLKLFPQANVDPATHGGNNYQFLEQNPVNRWELKGRIDYSISDNTKLFVSYTRQNEKNFHPITIWWAPNQALPYPSNISAPTAADNYSANLTHVFTPTLTNEVVVAYARYINPSTLENPAAADPANVGFNVKGLFGSTPTQIPNLLSWSGGSGFPGFYVPAFGGSFQGGAFGGLKQAPSVADNLTKVVGTHTMKFGFYWDFSGNQQTSSNATQGQFEFETYGATSTGNPLADLLIGHAQSYTQSSGAPLYDFRYHQYSFYAQDQWKATRKLTLTYGVRADHLGQWAPTNGPGLAVWNPSIYNNTSSAGAYTGLEWNAINKDVPVSGYKSPAFYFNPRFGLAYDVFGNGNTVVRGGIGVYRYQLSYNDIAGAADPPLGVNTVNIPNLTSLASIASYTGSASTGLGGTITALQRGDGRVPMTRSYDFIISQRLPGRSLLEIGYNGSQTTNMLIAGNLSNINLVPIGAYFQPNPRTGLVVPAANVNQYEYTPYANYQTINVLRHGSYSNYNGLQVSWQKQNGPITFTTNYTFGKVLGIRDGQTNNGNGNGALLDPYNIDNNYGVLAYDHTHIFNAAYVFTLPTLFRGNRFAAGAINGWEISGITQVQSGAPIQPNTGGNLNVTWPSGVSNNTYLGTSNLVLSPALTCDPRSNLQSGQYFNPSCFTTPAPGTNGAVIWPYIKGPAYITSDLAVYKNFHIRERQVVQFRFSAFNFLNHPLKQFNTNGTNNDIRLSFDAAGQNTNTSTNGYPLYSVGRRVVELALKYSF